MSNHNPGTQAELDRMSANLQKAIELTELALALRLAAMRHTNSAATMADVMHEIRLQKEAAWQRYAEQEGQAQEQ